MIFKELRQFIDYLEKDGELVRLKEEIQLEPDAGGIGRAVLDVDGPAVLAENIYGYTTKMVTGLVGCDRRRAIALGLPKTATFRDQKKYMMEAYDRFPVKPKMVDRKNAPCKQNVMKGDDVNLFQFPVNRNNTHDAGPYIYKAFTISKDMDSEWVNLGIYRLQVLDRNKTSILAPPYQHWGEHYVKASRAGKPLEMAVCIGPEPATMIAAGVKVPRGWSEYDYAGALRQEPVELVMADSVNLPVPATAEIILEGLAYPGERVLEGPFGEMTGSYSGCYVQPVFEVKTITYRNDPIFDTLYIGRPPNESSNMCLPGIVGNLERDLKSRFPQVTEVSYLYPNFMNVVVQGRWEHSGDPRKVMAAVWSSRAAQQTKMVTVVDEDVDPYDARDVMWAIAVRSQADTDLVVIPGVLSQLDPSTNKDGLTCHFGIDATKPRPPYRHQVSGWIEPRAGTEAWREKLKKFAQGGLS